jgi:RHS repeat-associated protein
VQETNASAQVTLTREYDPWGKLLQANGTGFAFTGREWDSETGHFYHRARYYDPITARFLGPDPSGFVDGPNLYRYVGNQPLRYRDPSGRNAIAGAIVGGSAAGPVGAVIGGVAGAGLGAVVGQWLWNNVVEPVFSQNERERRNPLKGEPGSESQTDNQTRRYGPDGYPESDFDAGHRTHNKEPHVHDWNRPKDGTPPTNRNRGPARDPMPGDPPPPRNATGCNLK